MHPPVHRFSLRDCRLTVAGLLASLLFVTAGSGETLPLDAKGTSLTFRGKATLHSFGGEAKDFTGHAELDPDAVPPIQKASLHFKTASLTTFQRDRDEKMRDWLHVQVHPEATFLLETVKLLDGNYLASTADRPARFAVAGTFTLNGTRQPLAGTAQGWRERDRVVVAGEITVDTARYGLPQIRQAAVLTVANEVRVTFRLAFVLPPRYAAP